MSGKKKDQYKEVLSALRSELGDELPVSIMTDFEKSEICAFEEVFTGISTTACLFHLGQSFLKRLKKLGLIKRFKEDGVRKTFRWAMSTAFLPLDQVRRAFALIISNAPQGMES